MSCFCKHVHATPFFRVKSRRLLFKVFSTIELFVFFKVRSSIKLMGAFSKDRAGSKDHHLIIAHRSPKHLLHSVLILLKGVNDIGINRCNSEVDNFDILFG